jgi:hypothetical protein
MMSDRFPGLARPGLHAHLNRRICPQCGSDDLFEVTLCTPEGTGWRECNDCNWQKDHEPDCAICKSALFYPAAYRETPNQGTRARAQALHHLRWADTLSDPAESNQRATDGPSSGIRRTVLSLLALSALLGLSWLLTCVR